jgi:hypothetical protein
LYARSVATRRAAESCWPKSVNVSSPLPKNNIQQPFRLYWALSSDYLSVCYCYHSPRLLLTHITATNKRAHRPIQKPPPTLDQAPEERPVYSPVRKKRVDEKRKALTRPNGARSQKKFQRVSPNRFPLTVNCVARKIPKGFKNKAHGWREAVYPGKTNPAQSTLEDRMVHPSVPPAPEALAETAPMLPPL